jgi:hypothetical protein
MKEYAMRLSSHRALAGVAMLLAGFVTLNRAATDAADDAGAKAPEDEMKALIDQDAKNISKMIDVGKMPGAANKSKASRAIKSDAMMIAFYANSRIGTKGADDAKHAALRDAAIRVAVDGGKKNFVAAAQGAKDLTLGGAGGKGPARQMNLANLAGAGGLDIEELMYQYKKAAVGGLDIENEIKAAAKKGTTPTAAAAIAARVLAVADYCDVVTVKFDAKRPAAAWVAFTRT